VGGGTLWQNGCIYIEAILTQRASGTQNKPVFLNSDMRKFEFHVTAMSNCEFTLPSSQTHLRHNPSAWTFGSSTTPQISCPARFLCDQSRLVNIIPSP
jgi:hypothetical protein